MRKELVLIFLFCIKLTFAQLLGKIDSTFNPGDIGYMLRDRANAQVLSIISQPDNKVVLGGEFTMYNGKISNRLVRLNIDGTVDTTFNIGIGFNDKVSSVILQPDGKILAAGSFTSCNGFIIKGIVRLNTDGSIDNTFFNVMNNWTIIDFKTLALQPDGKILAGGNSKNGTINCFLSRLDNNGFIDSSFNSGGIGPNSGILDIELQNDGKILIAGGQTSYNGHLGGGVMRLNSNGSIDTTFAIVTQSGGTSIKTIALQSTGKIIAGGDFISINGINSRFLARFGNSGELDTTFKIKTQINYYVNTVKTQNDDKIVFGGLFNYFNNAKCGRVLRIDSTGMLDPSFDSGSQYKSNGTINSIEIGSTGNFFIGGSFYAMNLEYSSCFEKLNNNGSRDQSIPLQTGVSGNIYTSGIQADGKIIIGGYFQGVNGNYKTWLARLHTNGDIDTSFKASPNLPSMEHVLVQPDKKIMLCGGFNNYNGTSVTGGIIRIDTNGTLDPLFSFPGFNGSVNSIIRQPDGKYLFGGGFKKINGNSTPRNGVARLLPNGSTDLSFNVFAGTTSTTSKVVKCLALQNDGKIVVGGYFPTFAGVASNSIIRIETTGVVDTTFHSGSGFNNGTWVNDIELQSDGKIILTTNYANSYNGISLYNPTGYLKIRLNIDGTLDTTYFNNEVLPIEDIRSRIVQSDGKIIISGTFTSYRGTGKNRICRVLPCSVPTVSVSNVSICGSGSVVLSAATSSGSLNWYTDSLSLTPVASGNLFVTPTLTSTTKYYVEAVDYYCRSKRFPVKITVIQSSHSVNSFTICSGSTVSVASHTYNVSGVYVDTLSNYLGCDSIITTQLTFSDTIRKFQNVTICANENFSIGSHTYSLPGNYVDSLFAVGGCDSLVYTNLTVQPLPSLSITSQSVSLCIGNSQYISVVGATSYTWSTGITSSSISITPTITTTYSVVGLGSNNCQNTQSIVITVNPLPTLTVTGVNTVCVGTRADLIANGATSYTWDTGQITASVSVMPSATTIYTVTGTDLNNCSNTETVSVVVDNTCQDVWPGDANSDGIADNLDILELGLHYTQTGPLRASVSNNWQSYFANNWTGTITNGKNLNHSDCNGDGIINDDDTLAIYNNYGLTHTFKPAQTNTVNPQLSIVPDQSMVVKGTWGTASVYLGDATTTINNINGVAFTIDFDNTLIEPNSIWIEYQNSFIDAGQNLYFRKLDFANSKLYTASTHTVSSNVNGFGKIATLHYKILSSLATDEVLNIGISQANQSNTSGVISPLTSGTGTLMAIGASVGVREVSMSGNVLVSPNPANGLLNISFTTIPQNTKIELYNSIGALVLTEVMSNKSNTINVGELGSGIYFMKVLEGNKVVSVRKVVRE
ncbi:MAG TPA: T9SS type A sorting domain-containing protein [Bacteroidia bacterium]|nr:T9SS type A sorting domain-containing protein [Bacteroidia bacterium]